MAVKDGSYAALGGTRKVGTGAVVAITDLTGGVPRYANKFLVYAEGGTIRWWDDGTDPTASNGMPLFDGCGEWLLTDDLSKVKFFIPNGAILTGSFYA